MTSSTARKLIAPVYAVLIVVGFVINAAVGVAIAVIGGMIVGICWSTLRGREHFDGPAAPADQKRQTAS
jgi:hypothetical protein